MNRCCCEVMFLQSCCGIIQEAKRSHRAQLTGRLSHRNRLSRTEIGKGQKAKIEEDGFLLGNFGAAAVLSAMAPTSPGSVSESWVANHSVVNEAGVGSHAWLVKA
eukprot:Skav220186  [mRNA]  locus=scaffold1074:95747:104113:- [translate_table: standard]